MVGILISKEKTFYTCEYCGSTMTLPKVSDDQKAALYTGLIIFEELVSLIKHLQYMKILFEKIILMQKHAGAVSCVALE